MRRLMLAVGVLAVICAAGRVGYHRGRINQAALERVNALGGTMWFLHQFDPRNPNWRSTTDQGVGPKELRRLFGEHWLSTPSSIQLSRCGAADRDLELISQLPPLLTLHLAGGAITDCGVCQLCHARKLISLDLSNTRVTSAGVGVVRNMRDLETLRLDSTGINGDAFEHIATLGKLRHLTVGYTSVGDDAIIRLSNCRELRELCITGTQVSDNSMAIIAALPKLEIPQLGGTQISETGILRLRSHPSLKAIYVGTSQVNTSSGVIGLN